MDTITLTSTFYVPGTTDPEQNHLHGRGHNSYFVPGITLITPLGGVATHTNNTQFLLRGGTRYVFTGVPLNVLGHSPSYVEYMAIHPEAVGSDSPGVPRSISEDFSLSLVANDEVQRYDTKLSTPAHQSHSDCITLRLATGGLSGSGNSTKLSFRIAGGNATKPFKYVFTAPGNTDTLVPYHIRINSPCWEFGTSNILTIDGAFDCTVIVNVAEFS